MLEWTILSHTHRHSPRSRSADTHQSYECRLASVHWNSWGTNQAREAAGECHISPCCCTSTQTHTQTQHMPPHAQKQTDYSSLFLTHVHTHSWARTSHTHKHMHSWAHVYTGWTDADRCERWGSTSRTFAHPTHQSTFHTDCMIHRVHTLFPPILKKIYFKKHPIATFKWIFLVETVSIPQCICCLYIQPPYLVCQLARLVYMTPAGSQLGLE